MTTNKFGGGKNAKNNNNKAWQPRFSAPPPPQNRPANPPQQNVRVPAWENDVDFDPYACQICKKRSHMALDCFHLYDYNHQGRHLPQQLAAMVAHSNSLHEDNTWLIDSGANQHVTGDLSNLHVVEPFNRGDKVAVGNGNGLHISHTGKFTLHAPGSTLQLKSLLHCPQAAINLLFINKFYLDNACFFVLTSSHFYVKDTLTG
ncbi:hypothetical protein CIPAW_01G057300 [Carya illinoinensis]|uniref:Retrovirus-related Pol polyprotein from transposon TNT 1-94-like beta-barrel domain-containing protein n=1 Tax=Carya illinoinensis TaxID=32201 RepID=A0A8T1RJJ3_CARIL|nr:hypothetical protein CIPAW_01G057300 [Carya illinoinensis]